MGTAKRRQARKVAAHVTTPRSDDAARYAPAWTYAAIFAAALLLRFLYLASIRHAYFFEHLQTEPLRYLEWSSLILRGSAPPPPYDEPPAYPFFVALVFALCGRGLAAVASVQALLDAVSCVLIAGIGTRWFGRPAGLIAGALAAGYGPLIYFTGELLPTTLFVFTAMAAIAAATVQAGRVGAPTSSPQPRWLFSGCLWALALVVRLEAAVAYPFVLLDAWRRGQRHGLVRTAAPLLLVLIVFGGHAVSAAWPKVLNTTAGLNLWLGNNANADGVNPFIYGPLQPVAEGVARQARDPAEADQRFRTSVATFWSDQPGAALRLMWKKFVWTWVDRELPNTSDIEWQTAQSWLFRRPAFPLSFGIVLPLAIVGALLVAEWRKLPLLIGLIVTGTVVPVIFFTNARFRLIMSPALILLAGAGAAQLSRMLRRPRDHRAALLLAACGTAVGIIVAWGNPYGVCAYRIPQVAVNTGVLERGAGNFAAAVEQLRAGLAGDPQDSLAWVQLALALEQGGQQQAALQAYLDGLARVPHDDTLPQAAAWFFRQHGLDPSLLDAYRHAESGAAQRAAMQEAMRAFALHAASRPRSD